MSDFRIEHLPVAGLKPTPRNARLHPKKQLHQIAASIREFGFNSIVVIDEDDVILVGHGRVEAARLAGLTSVPVLRITHLPAQQRWVFPWRTTRLRSIATGIWSSFSCCGGS